MNKRKIIVIGSICAYLIIVACALYFNIIPYAVEVKAQNKADEAAKEMLALVAQPQPEIVSVPQDQPEEKTFTVNSRYTEILEKYPDVVGKVTIDETNIDYLVVQAQDNDYYLHRDYDGNESKSGAIFMDYTSEAKKLKEELNGNIVMYGHNMKSGSMFHNLRYYKDDEYFKEHNIIVFETLNEEIKWEVFSVYVDSGNCIGNDTEFYDEEGYDEFLRELKERSLVETDILLSDTKCILSLVTCDYSVDDGRLFVHAKMIDE